ncbi:MAG: transposase, partial [Candidatus Methanomethylophilaceae archaeon]|nr:transposase [Candidatus Methanomethylophilaceae archaeon]
EICIALVAHAMQMRGLSINRMEDLISDNERRLIYDLSEEVDKNDLYRTGELLGRSIDPVIRHVDTMLRQKLGLDFYEVFIDWSGTYIDGKPTEFIRFGNTKDHRSDRPQINIGLTMDSATKLPIGLTVVQGNVIDVTHFRQTYEQVKPFLSKDCLIVFDNGGYSDSNAKLIVGDGFHFLTRAQINKSNDVQIRSPKTEWEYIDDDICAHRFQGNLGYTKCIYFSVSRYNELIQSYYTKANRDYDEMLELRAAMNGKKRPRKKHRNGNLFVDTRLYYQFQLEGMTRQEAIEEAVRRRISGREGYFILMSSKPMAASEMLHKYRSRNDIEDAYRDLKHGIDLRPLRCTGEDSIKGRVLIAFLAYLVLALARFLVPEARGKTADTLIQEISSFSVTMVRSEGMVKERIFSNFGPIMRAFLEQIPSIMGAIPRGFRQKKLASYC